MIEAIIFSLGVWLSVYAISAFKDEEIMSIALMISSVVMLIALAVTAQAYPWGYKLVVFAATGLITRLIVKKALY